MSSSDLSGPSSGAAASRDHVSLIATVKDWGRPAGAVASTVPAQPYMSKKEQFRRWLRLHVMKIILFVIISVYTAWPLLDVLVYYDDQHLPLFVPPLVSILLSATVYTVIHITLMKRYRRRCIKARDVTSTFAWELFQFIVSLFGCSNYILYTYFVDPIPVHIAGHRFIGYRLQGWLGGPFAFGGFEFFAVSRCSLAPSTIHCNSQRLPPSRPPPFVPCPLCRLQITLYAIDLILQFSAAKSPVRHLLNYYTIVDLLAYATVGYANVRRSLRPAVSPLPLSHSPVSPLRRPSVLRLN